MIQDYSTRQKPSEGGYCCCCRCLVKVIIFFLVTIGTTLLFLLHGKPHIIATQCRTKLDTEVFSRLPPIHLEEDSLAEQVNMMTMRLYAYQGMKAQLFTFAKRYGYKEHVPSSARLEQSTDELVHDVKKLIQAKTDLVKRIKDEEGMKNEVRGLCDELDTIAIPLGLDVRTFLQSKSAFDTHVSIGSDQRTERKKEEEEEDEPNATATPDDNCLQKTKTTVMNLMTLKEQIERDAHALHALQHEIHGLVMANTTSLPDEQHVTRVTEKVESATAGVRRITQKLETITQGTHDVVPAFKGCLEQKSPLTVTTVAMISCMVGLYLLLVICCFTTGVRKVYRP